MPKLEIDWDLFDELIGIPVITNVHLARCLKVSVSTLEHRVRDRFGPDATPNGIREQSTAIIRKQLWAACWKSAIEKGNVAMQIWLTKNLFGWHDKVAHTAEKMDDKLVINFGSAKPEQNQDKS